MADLLWTAQDAAKATNGEVFSDWTCTGVSIDTRTLQKGDLFVAIKGPSFDGHKFVAAALKAGAGAAMVSERPEGLETIDGLLLVDDTVKALEDLAHAARARTNAKVIAVTGSVGKTGVKEALAHVLSQQGKTHATQGNLNNHFGLPLTLARMAKNTEYAVLELGMNHAGELTPLSQMAKPNVTLITTIAPAHLEHFPNVEAIADAKCEIFAGLKSGGFAIINADNAHFERMHNAVKAKGDLQLLTFGQYNGAFRSLSSKPTPSGSAIMGDLSGTIIDYEVAHHGKHWVVNSLAVLAGVFALDADLDQAAKDLETLPQLKGRGEIHHLKLADGPLTLIDESYNANDTSMRAALDVLSLQEGRRIAVLGDMLELGPDETDVHRNLANAFDKIDLAFTCGPLMQNLYDALPQDKRGAHTPDADALAPLVANAVKGGDVVSIKSSRGSRTDKVLDALLELKQRN